MNRNVTTTLFITIIIVLLLAAWYRRSNTTSADCGDDSYDRARQLYNELEDRVQPHNYSSPNRLLPYLYIGDRRDAYDNEKLQAHGITHVLDMTMGDERLFENRDVKVVHKHLSSQDHPFFDIAKHFDDATAFIDAAAASGGVVLVHCNAGVSRSGIIAAMYMARTFGMDVPGALRYVKRCRRKIRPNIGFIQQLIKDRE
jgi:uncharacterized protein YcgL (UPF0745 family)